MRSVSIGTKAFKMPNNYLPSQDGALLTWLENFKTKIALRGAVVGLTPAQITDLQTKCDAMKSAIQLVITKQEEYKSAIAGKELAKQTQLGAIRTAIANLKTHAAYTAAIGTELGVVATTSDFDPATFKADIKAEIFGGFVRIKFKKGKTDGINLYHRRKGSADWAFLARDTRSPYDDHIVLETPNQPEHWEYIAYGVLDDAQIGLPSDIVEVVFGG